MLITNVSIYNNNNLTITNIEKSSTLVMLDESGKLTIFPRIFSKDPRNTLSIKMT